MEGEKGSQNGKEKDEGDGIRRGRGDRRGRGGHDGGFMTLDVKLRKDMECSLCNIQASICMA